MRFPADETEEPLDIDTIAKIIKTNKKTVYTRISRLLKKCKARFDEQGITVDDYFK
jgi:DNA-directed RNA polymerase specialized sigma24 family protein